MPKAPRTMTLTGLDFLGRLAAQKKAGVYLEIGPLFGSSTNVIHKNRVGTAPIHTIDTFEPAPWVKKRLGFDLSRQLFDKFTSGIDNMVVHEGFAPDVVRESWADDIGFYFDDATHGDPGWSDNFDFFSRFFNSETIICGDDFASGWPDIVRNVYARADEWGVKLYVMGRVWALARQGDERIVEAVNKACPKLKDVTLCTTHEDGERCHPAACWSWGLHQNKPLLRFHIEESAALSGQVVTFHDGSIKAATEIGRAPVELAGVNQIYFSFGKKIRVQLCLADASGKTRNTKAYRSEQLIDIPEGSCITALRLSDS